MTTSSAGVVRWTFADEQGDYVFEINPNAMASPQPLRQVQWDLSNRGAYSGRRAGRTPQQWSFSGVLRSQAQYDAFVAWVNRRTRLTVITDLGQAFTIRLVSFNPEAEKSRRQAPWRHRYTVNCLILH